MPARRKKSHNASRLLIALLIIGAMAAAYAFERAGSPDTASDSIAADSPSKNGSMPPYSELEKVVMPPDVDNRMLNYRGFTVAFNP